MDVALKTTGIPEIDLKLEELEPKLRTRILADTCVKAAQPVLDSALRYVPVRSGALASSMGIKPIPSRPGRVGARVVCGEGFFAGRVFYGGFQEFGWRLGRRPASARARSKTARFLLQFVAGDNRRKIPGKHFMARAANENRQTVPAIFAQEIGRRLDEVTK